LFCWECQVKQCVCGAKHTGKEIDVLRAACYSEHCVDCPQGYHWFFSMPSCLKQNREHLEYQPSKRRLPWHDQYACGVMRFGKSRKHTNKDSNMGVKPRFNPNTTERTSDMGEKAILISNTSEPEYMKRKSCLYRYFILNVLGPELQKVENSFYNHEDFQKKTFLFMVTIRAAMMIIYHCAVDEPDYGNKKEKFSLVQDIQSIIHRIEYLFSVSKSYTDFSNGLDKTEMPTVYQMDDVKSPYNEKEILTFKSRFQFLCSYDRKEVDFKKKEYESQGYEFFEKPQKIARPISTLKKIESWSSSIFISTTF